MTGHHWQLHPKPGDASPLICPSPSCCCSSYLVVHKQYFHQRPPQTLPRDLSGCWSRKWIFYSSLAWSITYKLLLYFVAGRRERALVGSDRKVHREPSTLPRQRQNQNEKRKKRAKELWMRRPLVSHSVLYAHSSGIVAKQIKAFRR